MTSFLIWSNDHHAWWRPGRQGYTDVIEEAGRYDRESAERIVRDANLGGELAVKRTDPVTGGRYWRLPEFMVLAPEDTPEEQR